MLLEHTERWAGELVRLEWAGFTGQVAVDDFWWERDSKGRDHLKSLADLLGQERVNEVDLDAWDALGRRQDQRLWDLFTGGRVGNWWLPNLRELQQDMFAEVWKAFISGDRAGLDSLYEQLVEKLRSDVDSRGAHPPATAFVTDVGRTTAHGACHTRSTALSIRQPDTGVHHCQQQV